MSVKSKLIVFEPIHNGCLDEFDTSGFTKIRGFAVVIF